VFTAKLMAQEGLPPVPDGVKKIQMFAGNWEGAGTMTMNGQTSNIRVTHVNTSTAAGWGIRADETIEMPGMPDYKAINILGYEAGSDLTHIYTISNYGECHDHWGKWTDDKTLMLQYDGLTDGKPTTEMLKVIVDNPSQYRVIGSTYVGGELVSSNEVTMKKK